MEPDAIDALVKAAPHVRDVVALIVGGIPVAEIVKSILVPPAAVVGKRMAERVERMFEKTGKMVTDSGREPKPVADKLLIEIVRGASLEDDEELLTMWAALLANAALSEGDKVRPGFTAILNQLSPDEARLLRWFETYEHPLDIHPLLVSVVGAYLAHLELPPTQDNSTHVSLRFDGLEAQQLVRREYYQTAATDSLPSMVVLTLRGEAFLKACQPPKPRQNG